MIKRPKSRLKVPLLYCRYRGKCFFPEPFSSFELSAYDIKIFQQPIQMHYLTVILTVLPGVGLLLNIFLLYVILTNRRVPSSYSGFLVITVVYTICYALCIITFDPVRLFEILTLQELIKNSAHVALQSDFELLIH